MCKFISILLLGCVILLLQPKESIIISKQAFTIEGVTSVGSFTCTYELDQRDTVQTNSRYSGDTSIIYSIPSDAFGCHNFLLNRDFRKTIKAKEFKEVTVEISKFRKKSNHYLCDLKLRLAGKERMYSDTTLKINKDGFSGFLMVQFSEFALSPPKKFGGLVKVKENIKISIDLTMVQ